MYSTRQQTSIIAQASQTLKEDVVIHRKLMCKRRHKRLQGPQHGDGIVCTDVKSNFDLIDVIDGKHKEDGITEKDEEHFGDAAVEASSEECSSLTSSICSGPKLSLLESPIKPKYSHGLCSGCRKLYQKAKRMKTPIKDKLLDNDPTSWTCDQWVLMKKWQPRRPYHKRGKPLVQVVQKRLKVKKSGKRSKNCLQEREPPACSRPHVFLQRNLQQCTKAPVRRGKKNTRRKRSREDTQDVQKSKQRRVHSNSFHQNNGTDLTHSRFRTTHSHSRGFEGFSKQQNDRTAKDLVVQLIPSAVTMNTTQAKEGLSRQKVQKTTKSFGDLLVQLHSNCNMIVQEPC